MTTATDLASGTGARGLHRAMSGCVVVAGAILLLAGCGKSHGPSQAVPAASSPPAASAPSSAPPVAPTVQAPAASAGPAASASSKLSGKSVNDLLSAARDAYAQHRLVAPAGNNAMEYYEAVLAQDPGNEVARDALRETFPFTVPDVEQAISQNSFDEANRELALLAKADPTNYTLTLLRAKLAAQQKLLARQQQEAQAKAQRAAEQLAAAQQAAAQQAAKEAAAQQAAKAATEREAAAKAAAAQRVAVAKAAPPPKPAGETHGAEVLSAAAAAYPVQAARNQTSGYAVVQFTVTPDGHVTDAHVVSASPRGVFDEAALRAVQASKYKPAMKDGEAVPAIVQRRLDFKFGG